MMSAFGRAALVLFISSLSACSTPPLEKSFHYSPNMSSAIVVLGVAPPSNGVSIRVSAVDPQTCRLTKFAGIGDKSYEFNELWGQPKHTKYVVGQYEPGSYVISSLTSGSGYVTRVAALNLGTLGFKVEPGDFIYIGDFRLSGGRPQFLGYHPEDLAKELARYPGLPKSPTQFQPVYTTFAGRGDGRVPGCSL